MKHAFLIEAHNNWWQLKQLIHQLDDPNHDIYVHVDKKSKDFNQDDFHGITLYSKLKFYQKYKVYWGGYSQVQVEMLLLSSAHENEYGYYHIISNADLLLWTPQTIQDFFTKYKGTEFIDCNPNAVNENREIGRRAKLYHFLQNYRRRYKIRVLNELATFIERVLLVFQLVLSVNRIKKLDWDIIYGSNWVSITDNLVSEILRNKDKIEHTFKWTNCADELFIQTIAWNCGYRDRIYKSESGSSNLRYIDWERGSNGNPYTFRWGDYQDIVRSGEMFARKFSEGVDRKIIEQIMVDGR